MMERRPLRSRFGARPPILASPSLPNRAIQSLVERVIMLEGIVASQTAIINKLKKERGL